MKKYFRATETDDGNHDVVQVGLDVQLGDAIMELIDQGVDENLYHWAPVWQDFDNDDLEFAINDSTTMLKMGEYIRPALVKKLRELLAERGLERGV